MSTVRKDTTFLHNRSLEIRGEKLHFSKPLIMGILNLTPDSFYDGGKLKSENDLLEKASEMLDDGADILDVGAYSSRPGAKHISEEEEVNRLLPAIQTLKKKFPNCLISVDTFRSSIAKLSVELGADIVNDISGGMLDANMYDTVANLKVPYILMHMQGNPETMQNNPEYKNVVKELKEYFSKRIASAKTAGINNIIIDPGFGFGKNLDHNYELMRHLPEFRDHNCMILAGVSRKSMVGKVIKESPKDSIYGTVALNTIALLNGADLLRVHDVKAAKDAVEIVSYYLNA